MTPERLRRLLEEVSSGVTSVDSAVGRLRALPVEDLGFACLDTHRALRRGFPEVIYSPGKTPEQLVVLFRKMIPHGDPVLATRVDPKAAAHVTAELDVKHDPVARALWHEPEEIADRGRGTVLVVCAGTSDMPVAEEAALTARLMGNSVERLYDVGVAGLHRVLYSTDRIAQAEVIIVVAGMEGALPSVVAGLCDRPVIAVPTSVGYGVGFGGVAALLGMLNSCSSGVTAVNIDNGFGAGYAAGLINRQRDPS